MTKTSALTAAAALTGTELVPVVQGGVTVKSTIAAITAAVQSAIAAAAGGSGGGGGTSGLLASLTVINAPTGGSATSNSDGSVSIVAPASGAVVAYGKTIASPSSPWTKTVHIANSDGVVIVAAANSTNGFVAFHIIVGSELVTDWSAANTDLPGGNYSLSGLSGSTGGGYQSVGSDNFYRFESDGMTLTMSFSADNVTYSQEGQVPVSSIPLAGPLDTIVLGFLGINVAPCTATLYSIT